MATQQWRIKSGKHYRGDKLFKPGDVLPDVTQNEWDTIRDKLEAVVDPPVFKKPDNAEKAEEVTEK